MKFILDTNVYIEATSESGWRQFEKVIIPILPFVYLCSVVSFELAQAGKEREEELLSHHIKALERVGRVITPSFDDWLNSAIFTRQKKRKSDLCDVLIAQCARSIGAVVFTFNFKDFLPLSKILGFQIRKPW